jgi:hypothetical protein
MMMMKKMTAETMPSIAQIQPLELKIVAKAKLHPHKLIQRKASKRVQLEQATIVLPKNILLIVILMGHLKNHLLGTTTLPKDIIQTLSVTPTLRATLVGTTL